MDKINPLKTNQQVFTWLCVCPPDKSASNLQKKMHFALILTVAAIIFSTLVSSFTFFLKYISVDFEACLYGLFQVAAKMSALNVVVAGLIYRRHITDIFKDLSKIYAASKNPIYRAIENKFQN